MSLYVLVENGVVLRYPYTITDMRLANPNVSFAVPVSDETAAEFGVYPVELTTPPVYDPDTESLVWVDPLFEKGVWIQQWQIKSLTEEEILSRLQEKRNNMIVSPLQAKVELLDRGLLDDVQGLVNSSTDIAFKLAWESAQEFKRLSPMIIGVAQYMGWDDNYLDDLFQQAAKRTF